MNERIENIIMVASFTCIYVFGAPLAWLLHNELHVPKSITLMILVFWYILANICAVCICVPPKNTETEELIPLDES